MKHKSIVTNVMIILVVAVISFYGGMKYTGSKNSAVKNFTNSNRSGAGMMNRAPGGSSIGGNRQNGGMISGEIIKQDDQSLTLKLRDGGSKIIRLSESAEISKFTAGSKADLNMGMTIMVNGKASPDGSIMAQTIQVRPTSVQIPVSTQDQKPQ